MNTPHPYRLRAYHNPEGIDESKVPEGWRFRYADEMTHEVKSPCRVRLAGKNWSRDVNFQGTRWNFTYIVPAA